VVSGDSFSGRVANAFLDVRARQAGVEINFNTSIEISHRLMEADFHARVTLGRGAEISYSRIREYHVEVFRQYDLDAAAWTASAPLDVIGRNYRDYGFSSPEAAQEALWGAMMADGFVAASLVGQVMAREGLPVYPSGRVNLSL